MRKRTFDWAEAIALLKAGNTQAEVAEAMGSSMGAIQTMWWKYRHGRIDDKGAVVEEKPETIVREEPEMVPGTEIDRGVQIEPFKWEPTKDLRDRIGRLSAIRDNLASVRFHAKDAVERKDATHRLLMCMDVMEEFAQAEAKVDAFLRREGK